MGARTGYEATESYPPHARKLTTRSAGRPTLSPAPMLTGATGPRVSDRGRILRCMPYLDRLATAGRFIPTTGDYRRARWWRLPRCAWILSRAFANRYDPAGNRIGCFWACLRWPITLLEVVIFRRAGELVTSPAAGRPIAVAAVNPGRDWSARDLAVVFGLIMVVVLPLNEAARRTTWWLVLPVLLLLLGPRLALAGYQAHRNRDPGAGHRPARGQSTVELSSLAAWPPRKDATKGNQTGPGFALLDAVLVDLDRQLPPGTSLILEPGADKLRAMYRARSFADVPGTHWLCRTTDPARPSRLDGSLN